MTSLTARDRQPRSMEKFFATCPRGLEPVLTQELSALGAREVATVEGGVGFSGTMDTCYAANLESRIASRVLWQVGAANYGNEHDIFAAARSLPWPQHFDVGCRIRVNVAAIRSPLRSLDFVTLRVKDAVCDAFRAAAGRRPDVDTARPDVRIHVFLTAGEATFYLDTSGEPLFKRGWRSRSGEAPLRENLAAGILRLTGWAAPTPLYDPMCGSGTFLVEAAMMALDVAPGSGRGFAFERLRNFEPQSWQALRESRRPRSSTAALALYGSDKSGTAVELARMNVASAGVAKGVQLKQMNFLDGSPPAAAGVLVANPPYGERQSDRAALAAFYPRLGDVLKQRYGGWTAYLFTADLSLARHIGLKATKRTPLYNGALECRLFEYRLVSGSMRRPGREER